MSKPTSPENTETGAAISGYCPALKTGFQETTLRVQEVHHAIAGLSFQALQWIPGLAGPARWAKSTHDVIVNSIYTTIRHSGGGLLAVAALAEPHIAAAVNTSVAVPPGRLSSRVRSALNAVVGDHLSNSANPLAISMGFYAAGHPIPLTANGLHTHLPNPGNRLCLFIHGLGCNEHDWRRASTAADAPSQDYGQRLHAELGYTPLYLRYNTGLTVADNGQQLARQLQKLLAVYPQPVDELVLIGHSMGGLVARSACQQASAENLPWLNLTRMVICLGSPHQGAPLEQLGHVVTAVLHRSNMTAPLGKIANARSAGIKNLRYGLRAISYQPPTTPASPGIALRFIGANLTKNADHPLGHFLGDGLVTLGSATAPHLGGDVDAIRLGGLHHMALLNEPRVYQQIKQWLGVGIIPSEIGEKTQDFQT